MTVASTTRRNDYDGNGTTASYAFSFKIFSASHLQVVVRNDTTLVETTLTLTTHYTVPSTSVNNASGGTISLVAGSFAWLDSNNYLKTGYSMTIRRVPPLTQLTDIRNQGSYFPETHEDQFDLFMHVLQYHQDEIDRAVRIQVTAGSSNVTIPGSQDGYVLGWDDDDLTNIDLNAAIQSVAASAVSSATAAAAASAAAALVSENNAETAETNAETAETNAEAAQSAAEAAQTAAEAAQAAAEAAAAGVNLPSVTIADANELLVVKADGTGFEARPLKDEDNMASDSATTAPTQQSVKAYVDSGAVTMSNKTLNSPVLNTGVSGTAIKDEDNMASDSATHLATQQSIKAYVDTSIAAIPSKPAILFFSATSNMGSGTTRYLPYGGSNAAESTSVCKFICPRAGTLRNLYVLFDTQTSSAPVIDVQVNGSDTALDLDALGNGEGTASNTSDQVAVSAGDLITVKVVMGLGITNSLHLSFELT